MMTKTPRGLRPAAFVPQRLGQRPRVAVPVDTQRGRKGESWRASIPCWDSSGSWKARTSPCTRSGVRLFATVTPTACAAPSPARRAASPTTARCSPCRRRSASAAAPAPRCAPPAPWRPTTRAMRPSRRRPAHRLRPTRARPISVAASFWSGRAAATMKKRSCVWNALAAWTSPSWPILPWKAPERWCSSTATASAAITGGVAPAPRRWWKPPRSCWKFGARP